MRDYRNQPKQTPQTFSEEEARHTIATLRRVDPGATYRLVPSGRDGFYCIEIYDETGDRLGLI